MKTALFVGFFAFCPAAAAFAQASRCPIDSTAPWAVVTRSWSREVDLRWSNDSLRRELLSLAREDQDARREFHARFADTTYHRRLLELDRRLSASVTGILDRFGLPTRSMVGAAGADAAFLVVQHSDSLQDRVLLMAKRAPAGEVPPHYLAMLEDRVLVRRGAPQRYGTQFTFGPDGTLNFAPVEDVRSLAMRRSSSGLPPLDVYVCLVEEGGGKVNRRTLPP